MCRGGKRIHVQCCSSPDCSALRWTRCLHPLPHPSSRSQSANRSKSCLNVPKRLVSLRLFPFSSAHNTRAVMLFFRTSKRQQHGQRTSIAPLLSAARRWRLRKAKISYACSPQSPEAHYSLCLPASRPYSYGLQQRQSRSAPVAHAAAQTLRQLDHIFILRGGSERAMSYS